MKEEGHCKSQGLQDKVDHNSDKTGHRVGHLLEPPDDAT